MKMKLKYCIQVGIVAVAATITGVSCTDTWDDHYDVAATVPGANLWESLRQDESIRPFVTVLDSCGYGSILSSNQLYTVWVPEITEAEAQQWISEYRQGRDAGLKDEDNPVIREFVNNHIALYNRSVSALTNDTITMMNGKRMSLTQGSLNGEAQIVDQSMTPASNGLYYKLDQPVAFFPNIYERIQAYATGGDQGLDSLYNYLLKWEREELNEEASVPGGVADGQTWYLDSVMNEYNEFFRMMRGYLDAEDSTYWYVGLTNKAWREQVEKNRNYFVYRDERGTEGDSLRDLYARSMFLENTFFNVNSQPGRNFNIDNPDSICSTPYSSFQPGYYMFEKPLQAGGLLAGLTPTECSNGRLYVTDQWNVPDTKNAVMSRMVIQAENSSNRITRPLTDSANATAIQVVTRTARYDDFNVSGGSYLVVRDTRPTLTNRPEITFTASNFLSNCPYDIKVVFATPLAYDTTAVSKADANLKRRITAVMRYYNERGTMESPSVANSHPIISNVDVDATKMDTVTVAENFVFPKCSYGEEEASVYLTIQSIRGTAQAGYAKDLYIDCVIFEPKPEAAAAGE